MYLLFDVGATKTRLVLSKDGKSFDEPKIISTSQDFQEGIVDLKKAAFELAGYTKIEAAAGGVAGTFNKDKTKLVHATNLPDWAGQELKKELERALNAPVFLENDTALVGLGEAIFGAGKEHDIVVYITISTGVNGVRVVDQKIDKSVASFEIGNQIINYKANLTLENAVSGSAMEKRFGKKPYEITDPKVWDEEARLLAYGLNNTILHWSPEVVVLGGSMMKEVGIPLEQIKFHLKNILKIYPRHPAIKKAALGEFGGLWGALAFLKQKGKI